MKSETSITKPHHLKSVASWQFQLGCKLFANGLPRATRTPGWNERTPPVQAEQRGPVNSLGRGRLDAASPLRRTRNIMT
jgi:hypothetical protein